MGLASGEASKEEDIKNHVYWKVTNFVYKRENVTRLVNIDYLLK